RRIGHGDDEVWRHRNRAQLAVFLEQMRRQLIELVLGHIGAGGDDRDKAAYQLDIAGDIAFELGADEGEAAEGLGAQSLLGNAPALAVDEKAGNGHKEQSDEKRGSRRRTASLRALAVRLHPDHLVLARSRPPACPAYNAPRA